MFLEQIMPGKETREYVLDIVSRCLIGKNNLEIHHIFIGNNGKSVFVNLIMKTFGKYSAAYDRNCTTESAPPIYIEIGGAVQELYIFQRYLTVQKIKIYSTKWINGNRHLLTN